jgi:hypothetical protein
MSKLVSLMAAAALFVPVAMIHLHQAAQIVV